MDDADQEGFPEDDDQAVRDADELIEELLGGAEEERPDQPVDRDVLAQQRAAARLTAAMPEITQIENEFQVCTTTTLPLLMLFRLIYHSSEVKLYLLLLQHQ